MIEIEDIGFEMYIPYITIRDKIAHLANDIMSDALSKDVDASEIAVVTILDGANAFAQALLNQFNNPDIVCTYAKYSSYKGDTSPQSDVELILAPQYEFLKDRHVIILDDIADSGNTLQAAVDDVKRYYRCRSVKTAALCLHKNCEFQVDYHVFEVDRFIVGFGMDYRSKGRCLNSIYALYDEL